MEQQGTVNNRTFVLLNFRSIIVATAVIIISIYIYINSFNSRVMSSADLRCRSDQAGASLPWLRGWRLGKTRADVLAKQQMLNRF